MTVDSADKQPPDDETRNIEAKAKRRRISGFWMPLVVALVAFLAGIGGSVIGGVFAYGAATSVQAAQEVANREAATQSKRADIYLSYLDLANKYALASQALSDDAARAAKNPSATTDITGDVAAWQTAHSSYQGEINQVYVYGSNAAWNAHQGIAAVLPPSLGSASPSDVLRAVDGFSWPTFDAAYNRFLAVMCEEVPAEPREGC